MNIVILNGKAGTGKTTELSKIINRVYMNSLNYKVLAFTHSAVDNIYDATRDINPDIPKSSFSTIHRFFNIDINTNIVNYFSRTIYDYIIIDEYSFISYDMFSAIVNRVNAKKIILCGDIYQLPPIIDDDNITYEELNKYMKLFPSGINNNSLCAIKHFQSSCLRYIYENRTQFKIVHNELITNHRSNEIVQQLIEKCFSFNIPVNTEFITTETVISLIINNGFTFLASKYNIMQKIYTGVNGKKKYDYKIEQNPPDRNHFTELYANVGDAFILTDNITTSSGDQLYNNQTCEFINYDAFSDVLTISVDNEIHNIMRIETLVNDRKYDYYPLMPHNIITIHKSQGKGYNNIIVCVDDLFEPSMLYTAVSRGKYKVLFYSNKGVVSTARLPNNEEFYTSLRVILKAYVM